jgi:hypothetical protein
LTLYAAAAKAIPALAGAIESSVPILISRHEISTGASVSSRAPDRRSRGSAAEDEEQRRGENSVEQC